MYAWTEIKEAKIQEYGEKRQSCIKTFCPVQQKTQLYRSIFIFFLKRFLNKNINLKLQNNTLRHLCESFFFPSPLAFCTRSLFLQGCTASVSLPCNRCHRLLCPTCVSCQLSFRQRGMIRSRRQSCPSHVDILLERKGKCEATS